MKRRKNSTGRVQTISKQLSWRNSWWRMQRVVERKSSKMRAESDRCRTLRCERSTSFRSMSSQEHIRRVRMRPLSRSNWSEVFSRGYLRRTLTKTRFSSSESSQSSPWWPNKVSNRLHNKRYSLRLAQLIKIVALTRRSCFCRRSVAWCSSHRRSKQSKKHTLTVSSCWQGTITIQAA